MFKSKEKKPELGDVVQQLYNAIGVIGTNIQQSRNDKQLGDFNNKFNRYMSIIGQLKILLNEVSDKTKETQKVLKGLTYLAKPDKNEEEGSQSLLYLRDQFYGDAGLFGKIKGLFNGRKITLEEGLRYLKKITAELPKYAQVMRVVVQNTKQDLSKFRIETYEKIAELRRKKDPLYNKVLVLQKEYESLEQSKKRLEEDISKKIENNEEIPNDLLSKMERIEQEYVQVSSSFFSANEEYGRLEASIRAYVGQIEKIEQLDEFHKQVEQTINKVYGLIEQEVPYTVKTLQLQEQDAKTIMIAEETLTFLRSVREGVIPEVNRRLQLGVNHLNNVVEETKKALNKPDFPSLGSGDYNKGTYDDKIIEVLPEQND